MAKKNKNENINQLDLFGEGPSVQETSVPETVAVTPVASSPVVVEPVVVAPVVAEVVKPVEEVKEAVVVENNSVQAFLKGKTEAEAPALVEIAGQVKMTEQEFTTNLAVENRFVSLSIHSPMVIVTPIPEDGSLNLKTMKEQFPTFVTQVQRVNDLGDQFANMEFLEKLKNMVDSKKKLAKTVDEKEIAEELLFIDKLESGEIEIGEDEKEEVDAPAVKRSARPKI